MVRNFYILSPRFMSMVGFFDRQGNINTLVRETGKIFVVHKGPLEILDDTIKRKGFNLNSALKTSRELNPTTYFRPIVADPVAQIVIFPTRSLTSIDNIWFNPVHINRTFNHKSQTIILFSNESSMIFSSGLSSFNTKLTTADQFRKYIFGDVNHFFILDPKKRPNPPDAGSNKKRKK